ncbi:MAG: protein CapI [Candidatus Doudnabacteria bacterium CG10_big_fil_rev_8_21_14_0_10_41_10]|uniref:Protein CapI n=1 Tax=Candidatus Doudnabacteria bacterium CG10_big_fil_rev_8_21_14_0_10_41_10 TaxID=1974551 RepID=A0A2H0VGX5_9BACT|nr:MAG: protein CapI [Candidatus Doudnabacteria bacterium CG10_big_fil_rev_8_21_14_0_10_41_10]
MSKILVTGGAGFIGSHVAKKLLEKGDEVVIVDNLNDYYSVKLKQSRLDNLLERLKFTFYQVDIADYPAMEAIFEKHKLDKICHLAAQAGVRHSLKDPFVYERSNNLGTLNLLELCKKYKVNNFIYASSSSIYGLNKQLPFSEEAKVDTPISIYAASKRYNELLAHTYHHLYGIHCTGLRFFTVYGPWGRPDMALFLFIKSITKNQPIKMFNSGEMSRDFTYIDDIVDGVVASIEKNYPYEIFNLGRGETQKLGTYVEALEKSLGVKAQKNNLPMQQGDVVATSADISKAKKMLGFNPKISIAEGVDRFVSWYKTYSDELGLADM